MQLIPHKQDQWEKNLLVKHISKIFKSVLNVSHSSYPSKSRFCRKKVNRSCYRLEIPVEYHFLGLVKAINWLNWKLKVVVEE